MDCVITPRALVDVSSAVPGVIESIAAERSERVQAGQQVAKLKSGVEEASVSLARARAAIETEIRLREVALGFDRENQHRLESLSKQRAASQHDWAKAERDVNLSQWKLQLAREEYRLRSLELRRAEEALKQKFVISPIDGVVVQRFRGVGEYVENQPIMRIAQLDPLYVEVIAPMSLFGTLHPGMMAEVVPELGSSQAHQATITLVDRMGDAASGTFGVRLELPNPDHALPAGLKCSVRIRHDDTERSTERQGPESGPKDS